MTTHPEDAMFMTTEKIEAYAGPKHQAPQDCSSQKGVTCDVCFAPMPVVENPVVRAARAIKELHLEHIAKMNAGFEFHKKLENGEMVDCNDEMRVACMEQIDLCNKIMEAASVIPIDKLHLAEGMLLDAKEHINSILDAAMAASTEEPLPEIGNYDHKTE